MIYTWVHSLVVIITKTKDTSTYEKAVMILAAVAFVLYIIGTAA